MKFGIVILLAASASALVIRRQNNISKSANTIVLKENNGVPGNECLTFRNNGEIVDAACVNEAADRQLNPSTIGGTPVLNVQRSFSADFRADLANTDACVGFNGTTFLAQSCADPQLDPVTFANGNLVSASGACQSGHNGKAEITVDPLGQDCVTLTSTNVKPTAPE